MAWSSALQAVRSLLPNVVMGDRRPDDDVAKFQGGIHRAGGPSIMAELDDIRKEIGRCKTGRAVATCAGNLPARWVFHAVGPIYRDGASGEPELLASCYRTCLEMAEERDVRTIAFPSISTGVYGYPLDKAAAIIGYDVEFYGFKGGHFMDPDAIKRATRRFMAG